MLGVVVFGGDEVFVKCDHVDRWVGGEYSQILR